MQRSRKGQVVKRQGAGKSKTQCQKGNVGPTKVGGTTEGTSPNNEGSKARLDSQDRLQKQTSDEVTDVCPVRPLNNEIQLSLRRHDKVLPRMKAKTKALP